MRKCGILLICLWTALAASAQTRQLERATPESQGVPSCAVAELFDSLTAVDGADIHSVVVVRHGKVIGELYPAPFAPEYKHTMYSCSKTFTSAAVGIAISENRLRLTDRVATFFPELLPDSVSSELAAMTVRNLLTMTSGIEPDWVMRNGSRQWIRDYLAKPVAAPGENFQYDSFCTYLLSAIVQKVTGQTTLDYLKSKVLTPMGITDVEWEMTPDGYNTGGWGLLIQPESMAKFGQLLLNGGAWNGAQLIPGDWVKEMMTRQQEAGDEDYCYQMWTCDYPGAVRADGAYGQYIIVAPDDDMVVVVTECSTANGKAVRHLIWDLLMAAAEDGALPEDASGFSLLLSKQEACSLPFPEGDASSPEQEKLLSGVTFKLTENEFGWSTIRFDFGDNEMTATVGYADGGECAMKLGYRKWAVSGIGVYPPYSVMAQDRFKGLTKAFHTGGSYAWDGGRLTMKLHYVDWISALTVAVDAADGGLSINVGKNYDPQNPAVIGAVAVQ